MLESNKNEICLKTLRNDISPGELSGKRVLLRLDLNLPIGENKIIDPSEEWRIIAALPTIKYLIEQNAKVIIMAHLGRPAGKAVENLRLGPIQDKLAELLDVSVSRMPDCIGEDVKKAISEMENGEVLMLENLRFNIGEEKNDKQFAASLASLGDIYVNDAFSDSHRAHASIAGIAGIIPSYAGFLMEKEIKALEIALKPENPSVAIIGGAKIETKIPVIGILSKIYDRVVIGGLIANQIIKDSLDKTLSRNVFLPAINDLEKEKYLDIGLNSAEEFSKFIREAKTIIWNGPMGKFEEDDSSRGTRGIIEAIKTAHKNSAQVLIGGGETIAAVQRFAPEFFEYGAKMYISTGGGAMLEFLAGKALPGIEALRK